MTHTTSKQSGIALLITIILTSTLLLVAAAIIDTVVKEADLALAGQESQYAFYAADSGIECAVYWDVKNPSGVSAFSTSTEPIPIYCNGQSFPNMGGKTPSSFIEDFTSDTSDPYCAKVTVTKDGTATKIEALGYNSCDPTNPRRVERAVRVTY